MREEQDRIATAQNQAQRLMDSCSAEYEKMRSVVDKAVDRIKTVHVTYRVSDNEERRKLNQGFFDKLFLVDGDIAGADLAEPYAQILDADLQGRIKAEQHLTAEELFNTDAPFGINYEKTEKEVTDEIATSLLSQIDWHKYERPSGALPVDRKNPAAYKRRRGSNLTLLAGLLRQGSNRKWACWRGVVSPRASNSVNEDFVRSSIGGERGIRTLEQVTPLHP